MRTVQFVPSVSVLCVQCKNSIGLRLAALALRFVCSIKVDNSVFNVPLSWESGTETSVKAKPSKVAFTVMQLVLDANGESREVVARVAGAEALGLDHPALPSYISFLPRTRRSSQHDDNSMCFLPLAMRAMGCRALTSTLGRLLEVRYIRMITGDASVNITLRNASLIFVAKSSDSLTLDSIVKALQAYGAQLAEYFLEHNREVKQVLESGRSTSPVSHLARSATTTRLSNGDSLTHALGMVVVCRTLCV